jgi:hypothetical protein
MLVVEHEVACLAFNIALLVFCDESNEHGWHWCLTLALRQAVLELLSSTEMDMPSDLLELNRPTTAKMTTYALIHHTIA